jgi:aspartyl-tRNA(Asn)/glutamyl-tRNA(Gln) amidotransferase subunit A
VDDVKGMKIGIPRDYFGEGLDQEVKDAILAAAKVLESKGAIVEEFDLSLVEYAIPAYYVIASAEASSNLSRFDGVKYGYRTETYEGLHNMYKKSRSEGFGPEVKRRIMLGSFVLSSGYYDAYYLKALRTKALIKKAFDEAFAKYDVILGPASPSTAPKLGESLSDPLKMYLGDLRQSGRTAGYDCALRQGFQGASDRSAADRRLLPGEEDHPRRLCVRVQQKLRSTGTCKRSRGGKIT